MSTVAPDRLTPVLLGTVLGTAGQLQLAELPPGWLHVVVAFAGLAVLWFTWRLQGGGLVARLVCLGVALLGAMALSWSVTGWRAIERLEPSMPAALEGKDLSVVGVVASLPRLGEQSTQFEFDVESAEWRGRPVTVPARVRLSWGQGPWGASRSEAGPAVVPVRPGERWRFTVRLMTPHGLSNPQGFDAELWLWEHGIRATGYVRASARTASAERLGQTWAYPVQQARHHVREALWQTLGPTRAAGVLVALLAGDQASITTPDWETFRLTGVAHLVSVSGVHVTMFAWLAMGLVGWLWRRAGTWRPALLWAVPAPVAADVGGVALAAAYAAFSGWGVPSQRTVLMLAAVVALRLSGRRWPWPAVWLLAMVAVVVVDPWALLQPGFWLSFVAVGVLFASTVAPPASAGGSSFRRASWVLVRTQAVVTLALAPLTLWLFGQFSLVGLVANLLAIPWVTLLVTPLSMLGAAVPGLWSLGALAVEGLMVWLEWLAGWPWAVVERPALPLALAGLAALGGVWLVWPGPWSLRAWGALLLWPALAYQPPRPAPGQFEVLALDVGQGSAIVVRTAAHTLLFDTGPPLGRQANAAERVVLPVLRAAGDRLDRVVVSHGDSDHAAGVDSVARAHPQANWLASFALPWGGGRCVAGQRWEWDGVPFEVLHPREADYGSGLSDNALSCVLRVGAGPFALLTGDITLAEETRLALADPSLRADLLVAPHHGSHTSSGPVWLNTVRPRHVVVQAGHRNRYGHPSPVVIRRLEARGIPWVSSPVCGAATWRSDEPATLTCHRERQRRYWHHPGSAGSPVDTPD